VLTPVVVVEVAKLVVPYYFYYVEQRHGDNVECVEALFFRVKTALLKVIPEARHVLLICRNKKESEPHRAGEDINAGLILAVYRRKRQVSYALKVLLQIPEKNDVSPHHFYSDSSRNKEIFAMSLFEQAAQLNNAGVTALLKGDQDNAINCMTKSIKMMKQKLTKSSSAGSHKSKHSYQDAHTVELRDIDTETIVFNQAIRIQTDGPEDEFDIHVSSVAVIFNLALAHHHKASSTGEVAYLSKAENLYAMVLRVIDDGASRTANLVKLASISNMSQIRFANGDYEQASEGLRLLISFMRQANASVFEEPKLRGLLMNALFLKAPRVAPAA
jgi:hypothetical protein